ncbi:putative Ig domain-containing protein [Cerasicoccus frondis]|uniref:putative Ig domain-containing protein n=1 Tax=Cerasicoccus frondis TaxID=490090 RepID=UPI002852D988|nr:putative Ig domain-containing protein [Cerasicoccus frondis]
MTSTPITAIDEDALYSYAVATSDPDLGDVVTLTTSDLPAWLAFDGDTLSGTPTNDDVGSYDITLTATDLEGATHTQAFSIAVSNVNDAPSFTSTPITAIDEDALYSYAVATSDPDLGDIVTVTTSDLPAWLTFDGTTLSGTPTNGDVGSYDITLTATDLEGATDTQAFSITVSNVNDAPSITSTPITAIDEDALYSYAVATSDPDVGDVITLTTSNLPAWLTFDGDTLSGTPTNDNVGSYDITFTATDLEGATDTQAFTITVSNVNDAPSFTSTPITAIDEDALYSYAVATSDPDADDVVTVTTSNLSAWLTFDGSTLSGTPTNDDVGSYDITLTATDIEGANDTQAFTITVKNVNDAPSITSTPVSTVDEDALYSYAVTTSDPDLGDFVTVTTSDLPAWLTFDGDTLSGTPTNDDVGSYDITLTATDLEGANGTQAFTITVSNVNDAPVITSIAPTEAREGELYQYQVIVQDEDDLNDGISLTYQLTNEPLGMSISLLGLIEWTPGEGVITSGNVTITVTDGGEDGTIPASEILNISVEPVDNPPIAINTNFSGFEDTELSLNLQGMDPEGLPLLYTILTLPTSGDLYLADGSLVESTPVTYAEEQFPITYLPALNENGAFTFTFSVSDGANESEVANASIELAAVNDAPMANNASVATAENSPIELTLLGADIDSEVSYQILQLPTSGILTSANGEMLTDVNQIIQPTDLPITYTPDAGFFGAEAISYRAYDGEYYSEPASLILRVTADPRSRTFTTTADFAEGYRYGVSSLVEDELSMRVPQKSFNSLWIPVYTKGTVCRIDIDTGRVLGEYWANPEDATDPNPTRVAIDYDGNAWIGNLRDNSIIKIANPESGQYIDRNYNGKLDTSNGLEQVLDWPLPTNGDDASALQAEDELILLYIQTDIKNLRHLSVDPDGNIWVGGSNGLWQQYDGDSGALLREETLPEGAGSYGGFIDLEGILYSTGNYFLRWDLSEPTDSLDTLWSQARRNAWAVLKDFENNIWVSRDGTEVLYKYDEAGNLLAQIDHGYHYSQGMAQGIDGDIWVAHSHCSKTVGHLKSDGTYVGSVKVASHGPTEVAIDRKGYIWVSGTSGIVQRINPLLGPIGEDGVTPVGEVDIESPELGGALWTYGDFGGSANSIELSQGEWQFSFDGKIPNAEWGPVTWNVSLCNDAKIQVEIATSNNGVDYGDWEIVDFEEAPVAHGRYLKGRVIFLSAETGESPILEDLTVGTIGYNQPQAIKQWYASAGEDVDALWPETLELKGAIYKSAHEFEIEPTYLWEVVTGPGSATFANNNPAQLRPLVNFSINGTYELRLTATAGEEISTDTVTYQLDPYNKAPYVNAGADAFVINQTDPIELQGTVRDDGLPLGSTVDILWTKQIGPGDVSFSDPTDPNALVTFSAPGVYILQLEAFDSERGGKDSLEIRVESPCAVSVTRGLVSWWQANFDAIDHVSGNVGFLENYNDATQDTYVDGLVAAGIEFDGVDDRMNVFASPSLDVGRDGGISWDFWFRPDVIQACMLTQYADPTNGETGMTLRINELGQLVWTLVSREGATYEQITQPNFTAGAWTHVAVTYNRFSGLAETYVNGNLLASEYFDVFMPQSSYDLFVAATWDDADHFDGVIDELTLFCRALNSEEVYNIYQAQAVGKCPVHSNVLPDVDAGGPYFAPDIATTIQLTGLVEDDGLPENGELTVSWSVESAPDDAEVIFSDAESPSPEVLFTEIGIYVLALTASDGVSTATDVTRVNVETPCEVNVPMGAVAWFPFNGSDEDVVGGHTSYTVNGEAYSDSYVGQSLSFNGSRRVRVQGSDLDLGASDDGFTIEFWWEANQVNERELLAWSDVEGNGFRIYETAEFTSRYTDLGKRVRIEAISADNDADVYELESDIHYIYSNLEYHHYTFSYNKYTGELRLYRDGKIVDRVYADPGTTLLTEGEIWIGGRPGQTSFSGYLDEVTFYSRALEISEVSDIYSAQHTGKCLSTDNILPVVDAGEDTGIDNVSIVLNLNGEVSDDGLPVEHELTTEWTQLSGPGAATFADTASPTSSVQFDATGVYELELSANDGIGIDRDVVVVQVGEPCGMGASPSIVAWWTGNQTYEDVIGDNDPLPQLVNFTSGKVGSAFSFGTNDHLQIPASDALNLGQYPDGFTIEFWCEADLTENCEIISWDDPDGNGLKVAAIRYAYRNSLVSTMFVTVSPEGEPATSYEATTTYGYSLNSEYWVHYAVVYDRIDGTLQVYREGILAQQIDVGNGPLATDGDVWIGGRLDSGQFVGQLDEISIYSQPLSSAQISSIYRAGSIGKCLPSSNALPVVDAGLNAATALSATLNLTGKAIDDGLPGTSELAVAWSQLSGPGTATFLNPSDPLTSVVFDTAGVYELQLRASDGAGATSDQVTVTVDSSCQFTPDESLVAWWSANQTIEDQLHNYEEMNQRVNITSGLVGSAFKFDQTSQIAVTESPALNIGSSQDGFTIEFWLDTEGGSNGATLLSWGDANEGGFRIYENAYVQSRQLYASFTTLEDPTTEYLLDGNYNEGISNTNFVHWAITYDPTSGNVQIFRNGGGPRNTINLGQATINTLGNLYIGGRQGEYRYAGRVDELSLYNRALTSTEIRSIYNSGSFGKCFIETNTPPQVIAGATQTLSEGQSLITLTSQVIDDLLPGGALQAQWSQTSGPANAVFPTQASELPAGGGAFESQFNLSEEGVYAFTLTVSDGEYNASGSVTLTVPEAANQRPTIQLADSDTINLADGWQSTAVVTDDGLPTGSTLSYQWLQVSGPGIAQFENANALSSPVQFTVAGSYLLRLIVNDGEFNVTDTIELTVVNAPSVALSSPTDGSQFTVGAPITITAEATDADGAIVSVEFFVDNTSVDIDVEEPYTATFTPTSSGYQYLTAIATDNDGNTGASATISVLALPEVITPIEAEIEGPAEDTVITAPTPIIGTVESSILKEYVLESRLRGSSEWSQFDSDTAQVLDDVLGEFDPTLLRNGIYDVRLTATDLLGRSISDTISLVVDTGMKIGQFSLAFEDLNIPVSGIPVQLLRTYDSRGSLVGDFGPGWDLGIRTVQVYENRTVGEEWYLDVTSSDLSGRWVFKTLRPAVVTVVLGDDQVEQFEATTEPQGTILGPEPTAAVFKFSPINGSVGSLTTIDGEIGYSMVDEGGGVYYVDDFGSGPLDPSSYVYTSPDGTKLEIQEIVGLRKVTDRNENSLTISEDGITHSSGKSIAFTRDAQGRITEISDPDGGLLSYAYDAQGRLSTFTDRSGNDPDAPQYGLYTEFRYENADFPNYLTTIIDPRGIEAIASEYDDDGRLIAQRDADGNEIGFTHDIPNRKETITDRLGNVTVHEYDLEGNVVATTTVDPNNPGGAGLTTTYEYDANRNETRMVDPLGNVTERSYDLATNNLLTETQYITGGDGEQVAMTTTYSYDSFSNPLTITDAEGNVTTFTYAPGTGDLLTQEDALGNVTTFTYDAAGNLTTMTDAEGNVTSNTYNSSGYVTSTTVRNPQSAILNQSTFTYDGRGNQTSQSQLRTLYDQQGNALGTENVTTTFVYDREDRVTQTTFADETFTQTVYNDFGQVAIQTDQEGEATYMYYDDRGNLVRTVYPDLTEERVYYDLENRRVAMTDRRGYTSYSVYDELGRMIASFAPDATTPDPASLDLSDSLVLLDNAELADNPMTSTIYDAIGRVEVSFDELGNPTTYEYDPNCGCSGRRGTVTNALDQTTKFAYSLNGNQLSVTDANLHENSFDYDDLNRPTKTIFHDGTFTETVYDELGRRAAMIDQEGKRTEYVYDGLGRLVTVKQPHPDLLSPDSWILTTYQYDELGNQISQTDAKGHTTYYQYDSLGRRVARSLPEGQTETYAYNDDGTLASRTDFNGYTTTYVYDELNRMTAMIADPDHPSLLLPHAPARIDYTYNDAGQRLSANVTNAAALSIDYQEWSYDERGRLVTQLTPRGDLAYTYDDASNLASVTSSNANGVALTYDYDALNRLESVYDSGAAQPPLEHGYTYDAVGNLESVTYANGVSHTWTYNSLNRLTNLTLANATGSLNSYTYTLRDSGHRSRQTETSGRIVDYTYDNLYRLTSETITNDPYAVNGASAWTYDLVGNRLSQDSSLPLRSSVQNHTFNENDWLDDTIYDDNGNTTLEDGDADEYDFLNRLIRRTTATGDVIDITYDADGNRVTKSTPAGITHYLVDMNNLTGYSQVLEELDSTLTVDQVYTYGLDLIAQHQLMPVESPTHWETSYYLYDGLGTVRGLTSEDGLVSDTYFYDAWGNLINALGTTPNSYLFTGEQWDADLGMYFLRARYMNPESGRFHTLDTYEGGNADPATLHKYLYVHSNPTNTIDPTGLFQSIAQQTVTLTVMQTLTVHLIAGYYVYAFSQALIPSKLKNAFEEAQEECGSRECVQFATKAKEILKRSKKIEGFDWEMIQYEAPIGALWLDGIFAVEGFGRFGKGKTDTERQVSENAKHVGVKIIKGIGAGTVSDTNILFAPEQSWRFGYEVNPRAAGIMTIQEADSLKNYQLYGKISTLKSKDLK